jgi:hypothetical protein
MMHAPSAVVPVVAQPLSALEQLIQAQAPFNQIKAEIERLALADQLPQALSSMKPLEIAIQSGSPQVVKLLLDHDTPIMPHYREILSRRQLPGKERIAGMLSLYNEIQSKVPGNAYPVHKTLSLIQEGAPHFRARGQNATLFIGQTAVGKSTLINVLFGTQYQPVLDGDGEIDRLLAGEQSLERSRVNQGRGHSETIYPNSLLLNQGPLQGEHLVDMPGFHDSRGLPYNICTGVSTRTLANCFLHVRALVVVCTEVDLKDKAFVSFAETAKLLGNIVGERPDLIKNVILLVNKATNMSVNMVLTKLALLANRAGMEPTTSAALRGLTEDRIIIIRGIPDHNFSAAFFNRMTSHEPGQKMIPQPFGAFNFASYHAQANEFQALVAGLASYQQEITQSIIFLKNRMMKEAEQKMPALRQFFKPERAFQSIEPVANIELLDPQEQQAYAIEVDQIEEQKNLFAKAMSLLQNQCIANLNAWSTHQFPDPEEAYGGDDWAWQELEERKAKKAIVDELMAEMAPVLPGNVRLQMGLKEFPTPPGSRRGSVAAVAAAAP